MDEEYIEIDSDTFCSICSAEFLDTEDLKLHTIQYHLNEKNKRRFCKFCSILFSDIDEFVKHIKDIHLTTINSCKYCTRIFNNEKNLHEHEKRHKSLYYYPKMSCSNCKKLFDNKGDLEKHEYEEHEDEDNGVMLQYCYPELSSIINMNVRSFFTAIGSHEYKCVCNYKTNDATLYLNHLNTTNCRSLTCNICCSVFYWKCQMIRHMQNHLQSPDKNNQCPKCNTAFSSNKIKSHIKNCRYMKCIQCDISFDSVDKYAEHATTHTQQPPVKYELCKYCWRPVVGLKALEKHIERSHKPHLHLYKYYCLPCNRVFKHPKFLFGHFFSKHKDLEPYTCRICDKKFRIRKNFTLHIKLEHKSVGFVEFDSNFHVFFTDKKSEKPFEPKNMELYAEKHEKQIISIEEGENKLKPMEITTDYNKIILQEEKDILAVSNNVGERNLEIGDKEDEIKNRKVEETDMIKELNCNQPENNDNQIEIHKNLKPDVTIEIVDQKDLSESMNKDEQIRNETVNTINLLSSDDSDVPLSRISKQRKRRKRRTKKSHSKKFTCEKCDRDCYTYQNYHRHMSLHMKHRHKTCLKCSAKFKTKEALNKHIKNKHSYSQLTETLKKLLDKRKTVTPTNPTELFQKTIHKVPVEKSSHATILVIDTEKSPVKKFLENFKPENTDSYNPTKNQDVSVNIKKVTTALKEPMIKMQKFISEPTITDRPKLRMPVKFKDENYQRPRVSIKLVRCEYLPPGMTFNNELRDTDSHESYNTYERNESIPDVGQEIQLEGSDEKAKEKPKIIINDVANYKNLRIGHLSKQAPFYKIIKIDDVLTQKDDQEIQDPKADITLPNGIKLVTVNPLAHLLDKANIEIKKSKKSYRPKVKNFGEAIAKAMHSLDKNKNKNKDSPVIWDTFVKST